LKSTFDESNVAIGTIVRYLHTIAGKIQNSAMELRKKFHEITHQISKDMYGPMELDNLWTNIQLTTCDAEYHFGPSLEDCIATYNSDWSKNKTLFDVDPNRKGIQKLRIVTNGSYEIKAWGAGNVWKTGSGNAFRYKHIRF